MFRAQDLFLYCPTGVWRTVARSGGADRRSRGRGSAPGASPNVSLPDSEGVNWEQRLAAMPDNAPAEVEICRDISEIRDDTERILDLLEGRREGGDGARRTIEGHAT